MKCENKSGNIRFNVIIILLNLYGFTTSICANETPLIRNVCLQKLSNCFVNYLNVINRIKTYRNEIFRSMSFFYCSSWEINNHEVLFARLHFDLFIFNNNTTWHFAQSWISFSVHQSYRMKQTVLQSFPRREVFVANRNRFSARSRASEAFRSFWTLLIRKRLYTIKSQQFSIFIKLIKK